MPLSPPHARPQGASVLQGQGTGNWARSLLCRCPCSRSPWAVCRSRLAGSRGLGLPHKREQRPRADGEVVRPSEVRRGTGGRRGQHSARILQSTQGCGDRVHTMGVQKCVGHVQGREVGGVGGGGSWGHQPSLSLTPTHACARSCSPGPCPPRARLGRTGAALACPRARRTPSTWPRASTATARRGAAGGWPPPLVPTEGGQDPPQGVHSEGGP